MKKPIFVGEEGWLFFFWDTVTVDCCDCQYQFDTRDKFYHQTSTWTVSLTHRDIGSSFNQQYCVW